jgi:hypothetical protein
VLQSFRGSKSHIYSVHRSEVADKKAALPEEETRVARRYIRVVYEENRAFFATHVRLVAFDLVFTTRLAVLSDHDELGALIGTMARTELKVGSG